MGRRAKKAAVSLWKHKTTIRQRLRWFSFLSCSRCRFNSSSSCSSILYFSLFLKYFQFFYPPIIPCFGHPVSAYLQIQTKKRPTLAKRFKCPFCANDDTVECKMDFRAGIGSLSCRLCGASYQMPIHHLHEPVDVFSEWLDDCEAAAQGKPTGSSAAHTGVGADGIPQYESESDDDLGEASGLNAAAPAAAAAATATTQRRDGGGEAPSYSALGLDDSDDDDSE
jgi:transcription elongation factor Elf1